MIERAIFVTGNPNKLAEAQAILPFDIATESIDLTEIQSLDVEAIVSHKLTEAYGHVGEPVIVEDVSAELESLGGLPGPFIKFFEQVLGEGALYKLSKVENDRVRITCCMGYFDGQRQELVRGSYEGTVVAPRGENGWGFDKVIVPDGETRTMAEMEPEEKNRVSHRYLALQALAKRLQTL